MDPIPFSDLHDRHLEKSGSAILSSMIDITNEGAAELRDRNYEPGYLGSNQE
jgi:hypothetical protein